MSELPPATLPAYLPPLEPEPESPEVVRRDEVLRCTVFLIAGLFAWGGLAASHPTGPAWVLVWVIAPAAAVGLVVAALATPELPSARVQLGGYLGLAMLCLSAWGWLGVAVPALGWPAALAGLALGLPLLLLLVAMLVRVAIWLLGVLDLGLFAPLDRAKERARVRRWARWNAERDARWKAEREGRPIAH